jgi:hypothetical protein
MDYEKAKAKLIQAGIEMTLVYDRHIRSQVMYNAIYLEGLVGQIIAWHFCPNEEKHLWFNSLIFQRGEISFSKRIIILKEILQQFYPDIYAETKGVIDRLDKIRDIRNKFAHAELVLEEDKLLANKGQPPDGIYLRTIKKGKAEDHFYREQDMHEHLKLANNVGLIVQYILADVKNRVTGGTENLKPVLEVFKRQSPQVISKPQKPSKTSKRPRRPESVD